MKKKEKILCAISLTKTIHTYNKPTDSNPTTKTFVNLYKNEVECVGKEGIEDALEYFNAYKAAKILNCSISDLAEFSGESPGGADLLYDIILKGQFIDIIGTLTLYRYKEVNILLEDLENIVGGLLREEDIPVILK